MNWTSQQDKEGKRYLTNGLGKTSSQINIHKPLI